MRVINCSCQLAKETLKARDCLLSNAFFPSHHHRKLNWVLFLFYYLEGTNCTIFWVFPFLFEQKLLKVESHFCTLVSTFFIHTEKSVAFFQSPNNNLFHSNLKFKSFSVQITIYALSVHPLQCQLKNINGFFLYIFFLYM